MSDSAQADVPWRVMMLSASATWTVIMIASAMSGNDLMIGFSGVALAIHIVTFLIMLYSARHVGRTMTNLRWIIAHKVNIGLLAVISFVIAASGFYVFAFLTWNALLINAHYYIVLSTKTTTLSAV